MNPFDSTLRKMAKREKAEVPESVKYSVDAALNQLPEENVTRFRPRIVPRLALVTACLAFVMLFLMPNVSPVYAEAMEKIPVIGEFIKVVTIRNYTYKEGNYDMDLKVPEIKNDVADDINEDVRGLTEVLLNEFYADLDLRGNSGYGTINMDYIALADSDDWFTLKLTVSQTAASSDSYFRYYHIDKNKGKIIKLQDLFADESYSQIIKNEIKKQMRERMEKDPENVYWVDSIKPENDFINIDPKHNFYWSKEGNLVIPFDKYEVGPGSSGCPEFEIPQNVIEDILRPEYRNIKG